jgi:hypothetical protein
VEEKGPLCGNGSAVTKEMRVHFPLDEENAASVNR